MIFGTCYDVYVARPLDVETEHQRQKQKRHDLVKNSIKQDEENADKTSKVSSSINLQPHGIVK